MIHCSQAGCLNDDLKAYKTGLGSRAPIRALCSDCASALSAIGMRLLPIERRATDLPVLTERRRTFRPRWLSRLTAREMTGQAA